MFSIGLLIASFCTIISGYSFVLLWNWVPEKPPTELPLPPSLDYIHLISWKILWGYVATIALLLCVAVTSRLLDAISLAITAWGSVLNLFRPLGQAASSALVRVGFIPLFRIAAKSLFKTMFVQRIFRFCEWTFVTLCIT